MLKKKYRLSSSSEIRKVLKHGRYKHINDLLMVKWVGNRLPNSRITTVISLKVDKKAVIRNRIKRVLLEGIEESWMKQEIPKNFDVVIVAKKVTLKTLNDAKQKLHVVLHSVLNSHKK